MISNQTQKTFIHHCNLQWRGSLFQTPVLYTLWSGAVLRILSGWDLPPEALMVPLPSKVPQWNVSLAGWSGSQLTSLSFGCLNMNYLT